MYEAWNYLGYAHRKLGDYQAALTAYDRTLNLKPGYPEAIEYRGHAYLGLNRLEDAKQAYLALFADNRKLASQLLAGMQAWVGEHRGNPVRGRRQLARGLCLLGERAQCHCQPDRRAHPRGFQRRLVARRVIETVRRAGSSMRLTAMLIGMAAMSLFVAWGRGG